MKLNNKYVWFCDFMNDVAYKRYISIKELISEIEYIDEEAGECIFTSEKEVDAKVRECNAGINIVVFIAGGMPVPVRDKTDAEYLYTEWVQDDSQYVTKSIKFSCKKAQKGFNDLSTGHEHALAYIKSFLAGNE